MATIKDAIDDIERVVRQRNGGKLPPLSEIRQKAEKALLKRDTATASRYMALDYRMSGREGDINTSAQRWARDVLTAYEKKAAKSAKSSGAKKSGGTKELSLVERLQREGAARAAFASAYREAFFGQGGGGSGTNKSSGSGKGG